MVSFPTVGQDPWGATLNAALTEISGTNLPSDHGWISWAYHTNAANSQSLLPTGTLNLIRVQIRAAATVNNIVIGVSTAGSTLTAGQNFAALYSSAGTRVGVTADQSGVWTTTGVKTMALTAPVLATPGFYWVALLANGTTAPQVNRASAQVAQLSNGGTTAATSFFGTSGAGLTSTPASFSPAGITPTATEFFAAVS